MSDRMIYVVVVGEYSSYGIVGVYDDESVAGLCVARHEPSDHARIEEYVLNPGADGLRTGLNAYLVHVGLDGSMPYAPFPCVIVDEREGWNFSGGGTMVCFRIWARDEEHARKIASERWARLKHDGTLDR